ncbi:MAG: threonine synthase [bacterium]|nr:threonine synthase [bacterium]
MPLPAGAGGDRRAIALSSQLLCLECLACGSRLPAAVPRNLCDCGRPLLARYDLAAARDAFLARPTERGIWRHSALLPVGDPRFRLELGEGDTPVLSLSRLGQDLGLEALYLKDEGANPTGTFKARGAAVAVSRALELGIKRVIMPSAGNAGGAWAAYCARAGIRLRVVMPEDAPATVIQECRLYGAEIELVRGLLSDAGRVAAEQAGSGGWFEAATLKEPYRLEGKKTMGYELFEHFGDELDAVVYPCGGGVGLIGIDKAYRELAGMGLTDRSPRLIAVQAVGCAPLVKAFHDGAATAGEWPGAATIAAGLRVPRVLGDTLALEAIRRTGGGAMAVDDDAILAAMLKLARLEGLWICPEGAAAVAALPRLLETGAIRPSDRTVLLNTGLGLKYPEAVALAIGQSSGGSRRDRLNLRA